MVPADLPCLSSEAVTQVLRLEQHREGALVPDRASTGTTLVLCPPRRPVLAQYGPGSAGSHRALGLRSLDDAPLVARRDVDTLAALNAAAALGLGARTAGHVASVDGHGLQLLLTS